MRTLPDPEISLRDASDFIFDSALCRKALHEPDPRCLAVLLREIIAGIHRLTVSCHLPEFTDHGLSHLCSLVDRISRWTSADATSGGSLIVSQLKPEQCAVLLVATLLHDIGMLSQRPEDLPAGNPNATTKPLRDIPNWVRRTHIDRMEGILTRILSNTEFAAELESPILKRSLAVAKAHGLWPWEWSSTTLAHQDTGLAAMLAVADLLDEDAARCDSGTLLRHRYGTAENCAHWIRHGLTKGRVLIENGQIRVKLVRPPNTDAQFDLIFDALRNHFLLVRLYLAELGQVGASILSIDFTPPTGGPSSFANDLSGWDRLQQFQTQSALIYHLLGSFMPEALVDQKRISTTTAARLTAQHLIDIDLSQFYLIRGTTEARMALEQDFQALISN
jgi:hypothetical protein